MQGLFLFAVWAMLLAMGLGAPFAFGLGYLWVDMFAPQVVDPAIVGSLPVSLVMGAAAFGSYLLLDRRASPGLRAGIVLPIIWGLWISLTTTWAVVPDAAWAKWDWAYKTVLFSAFVPFMFRSRVQIEAAVLVLVLSVSAHAMAFGLKTLVSGGGYDYQLGLISGNFGLGESSTLAITCVAILPLLGWARKHSLITPRLRGIRLVHIGLAGVAVLATLGTYARAGLVSLGLFAGAFWWSSKHKIALLAAFLALGLSLAALMGDRYEARMATIAAPAADQSASTRLAVWEWTWKFALAHPFGGGFDAYRIDNVSYELDGREIVEQARAFHSMYLEVLGEQGFVGAAIFGLMLLTFLSSAWRIIRRTRDIPELAWMRDLARALLLSAIPYLAGGAFVGIAFQPFHYYLFALTVALLNHLARSGALARPQPVPLAPRRRVPEPA